MLSVAAPTAYHIQRRISSREGALPGKQELDHTQLRDTIGAAEFKRKQAAGTDQFPIIFPDADLPLVVAQKRDMQL